MSIQDWQRRFRAAPAVWLVIYSDGVVTNAYDSKEAAQLEVEAARSSRPSYRVSIQKMNVHDLRLATERWCNNFALSPPSPATYSIPMLPVDPEADARVCDACWGSGDPERPGVNLREHASEVRRAVEEAVAKEREACAQTLEKLMHREDVPGRKCTCASCHVLRPVAAAIRSRGGA